MVKNLPVMQETSVQSLWDPGSIPGSGRYPGEENGNPLQSSCLEDPHGYRSLAGYSPGGLKESDRAEQLHFDFTLIPIILFPSPIGDRKASSEPVCKLQSDRLETWMEGHSWRNPENLDSWLFLCVLQFPKAKNEGSNTTCFLGGVQHQLPSRILAWHLSLLCYYCRWIR